MGKVYILTNPALDGWVKIGLTEHDDVQRRIIAMNTAVPFCFKPYAVYEVDDAAVVERRIHQLIELINPPLRAHEVLPNGKAHQSEFFKMSPQMAYAIFRMIAILRDDLAMLHHIGLAEESSNAVAALNLAGRKKTKTTFAMLGLSVGAELRFIYNDEIICRVKDANNKVEYDNRTFSSISQLATDLLREQYAWSITSNVNGYKYFTFEGEILTDRRIRFEMDTEV